MIDGLPPDSRNLSPPDSVSDSREETDPSWHTHLKISLFPSGPDKRAVAPKVRTPLGEMLASQRTGDGSIYHLIYIILWCHNYDIYCINLSVVSDTLQPHEPTRLLHPGIFQARILEWVSILFSRGSSQSRDWTQVSRIVGSLITICASRGAINIYAQ